MPSAPKYKFDQFEADVNAAELLRSGTRLKLQMQPFQVLVALLERPREVVTREELRQRLWPQDTFVDFDHGLNTAMAKLRDVLGDSAATPRYIETIAKRGYRFLGDVKVVPGAAAAQSVALPVPLQSTTTGASGENAPVEAVPLASTKPGHPPTASPGTDLPQAPRGIS